MATLTVAAVVAFSGSTFTAGAGLFAAAVAFAAASYVDNRYILPWLFPEDIPDADLPAPPQSSAEEGAGSNFPIGREVRVPAQMIWLGPFKNAVVNGAQTFKVDVGIAYAKMQVGHDVDTLLRIYGNGLQIYDFRNTITVGPATTIAVVSPGALLLGAAQWNAEFKSTGPDLTALEVGQPFSSIVGFATEPNKVPGTVGQQKTATLMNAVVNADNSTQATIFFRMIGASLAATTVPTEAAGPSVTMIQSVPNIRKKRATSADVSRKGDGLETVYAPFQTHVDPTTKGVPAHKHTAHSFISELVLLEFGNRLPTFEVVVDATGVTSVNEAMRLILQRSPLVENTHYALDDVTLDATANEEDLVVGYNVLGLQSPAKSLEPIMLAHNVATQINRGMLHFFKRQNATVKVVYEDELGVYDAEDSGDGNPFEIDEVPRDQLPTQVTVTYVDLNKDSGEAAVSQRLIGSNLPIAAPPANIVGFPKVENKTQLSIPIAMKEPQARKIATLYLTQPWVNRKRYKTTLAWRHFDLLENDILEVRKRSDESVVDRIVVMKALRGLNGVIEVSGFAEASRVFDPYVIPADQTPGLPQGLGGESTAVAPPPSASLMNNTPL